MANMATRREELGERVSKGADWFDAAFPGWARRVNLNDLDMSRGGHCVLSIITRSDDWHVAMSRAFPTLTTVHEQEDKAVELGFLVRNGNYRQDYNVLDELWTSAVMSRLGPTVTISVEGPELWTLHKDGNLVGHLTMDTVLRMMEHYGEATYKLEKTVMQP